MIMKNKKKGIFSTLMGSYILFSVFLVISLLLVALIGFVGMLIRGDLDTLDPYQAIHSPDSILYKLGGWAEILDRDLNVVLVKGEKKDEALQYSMSDLLRLSSIDYDSEYKTFVKESESGYELFKLPSDVITLQYTINVSNFDNTFNGTIIFIFVSFLLLYVGNCILFSLYLKRKISKPVNILKEGMLAMNTGADRVVLDPKGPRELIEIQNIFNDMVVKLNESERRKNEMEASKSQMLMSLSHDIKTPMSSLKIYAKAMRDGLVSGDRTQEYLQSMDAKVNRVNDLLDDMFIMIKMENPDYQPMFENQDAGELVREICAEYYDEIKNSGLELIIDIKEMVIPIRGDKNLLQRAVSNLLSNGIKYNQTGDHLAVCVKSLGGCHAEITVEDDGEPIEEGLREHLFDMFIRGDDARTSAGGSGIGLSIAKGIAKKHDGSLEYKYENNSNHFILRI